MHTKKVAYPRGRQGPGTPARKVAFGLLAALLGAGLVTIALSGGSKAAVGTALPCQPRLIEVDLSSAARGPQFAALGQQIIDAAATSAVVCGQQLSVYGVSGGGSDTTVLNTDDLTSFTPIGPNATVRSERFGGSQQAALDHLITRRLLAAYQGADPRTTSIAAMYAPAAQESGPSTEVILISTGVNNDAQANLNQPLAVGQGIRMAQHIQVPRVRAAQIVEVGVGQVDASTPPPSPQWPSEVLAFNQALCRKSGASACRMFNLTSPSQALNY